MGSTDQADPGFFLLQNFMNIDGMVWFLFFSSPSLCAGPQKSGILTASRIEYEIF